MDKEISIHGRDNSVKNLGWCAPRPSLPEVAYLVLGEIPICNYLLFVFRPTSLVLYLFVLLLCTYKKIYIGRGLPY
jgi:hypothetical protein